jgi:hypothetical protein
VVLPDGDVVHTVVVVTGATVVVVVGVVATVEPVEGTVVVGAAVVGVVVVGVVVALWWTLTLAR